MWLGSMAAWAEPPPAVELAGVVRRSDDVTVFVRADGALTWQGEPVLDYALAPLLKDAVTAAPDARLVVAADPAAPHDAVMRALELARQSGAARVALESGAFADPVVDAPDPLFAPTDAVPLGEDLSRREARKLRPKHHRFPQNPYGNTVSYSAYTLEPGEAKLGIGSLGVGVVRGVQVGTAPLLDVVGVFNANAKIDFLRRGPVDVAVLGQYYTMPLTGVLEAVGAGRFLTGSDGTTITSRATYTALGGTASVRLAQPWTLHTQLYWASPSARGEIAFDDLPDSLLPGVGLPDSAEIGLGVRADLGVLNLATDVRFNRRDSLFAWLRYPFYGRVRGLTDGAIEGFPASEDLSFVVQWGGNIALRDSYSFAVGYQASWRHVEARVGVGWSAVPATWLLQAFELSYRFGGPTRRHERDVRQGYRDVKGADEQR